MPTPLDPVLHLPDPSVEGALRARRPAGLRRRWTRALALAEVVGFLPPALTGVALVAVGATEAALVAGLVVAGLAEGAVIGAGTAVVLRRTQGTRAVPTGRWISATTLGAGVAWLAGMGGSALLGRPGDPVGGLLLALVPAWVAGLVAMPWLQARVLRRAGLPPRRWVAVGVVAWAVGVVLPIAALSGVPDGAAPLVHVLAGVGGAVAMGLLVGWVTGGELVRIVTARPDGTPVHDGADQLIDLGDGELPDVDRTRQPARR